MMWRRRTWLLCSAIALPLLLWAYDRTQLIYWVGSTDLTIEFVMTDIATGSPIAGAVVEVQSGDERNDKDF
jgi:hypothetical protein